MSGPLAGVRVLDLANRSGAFCGRLLAELGAEVLLIEPPGGGDLRRIPPFLPGVPRIESSLPFHFYAAGRRGAVLDLDTPSGREQLARLAAEADALIETGPPGRAAELRHAHPRLIVASITPFGQRGPWRAWRAPDLVAQALGGMLYVSGHEASPPQRSLGLQAYHQAGIFAAIGILGALFARDTTGRGELVDVSIQAAVAAALEHVPGLWHQTGEIPRRQGTLHWTRFFRVARCRDGSLLQSTLGDWTSLFEWVKDAGLGSELASAAWEDPAYRKQHAEQLFDVLEQWAAGHTVAELHDGAQLRRIPFAAVRPPEALLADPHLHARGFFAPRALVHGGDRVPFPGPPFRLAGWTPPCSAPSLDPQAEPSWGGRSAPAAVDGGGRDQNPPGPLAGIRILDFTWVVAGPVATRVLADLGADVVKVERPDAQDFGDRRAGLSGSLMRGKRSLVLDLRRPRGREVARALAARCDVVIDNFSARVMENLELDHATLRRTNPGMICVRMTGFGLTGPDRDHVSYGPTLQALTGYTLLMGEEGQPPAGFGYSYSDLASGNLAALAVLAALRQRQRTGEGQLVDFAQLEAVAALIGPLLLERATLGGDSAATGNASQEGPAAPHGVYPTAGTDRWIAIAVFGDSDWDCFTTVVGNPPWTRDPRFTTLEGRLRHRAELDACVTVWTGMRPGRALMHALQEAGVAAGIVADARDLCDEDPQLAARGHFVEIETPEGRRVRVDRLPVLFSDAPVGVRGPAPLLGEHSDAVLIELLGYGPEELAELRGTGVFG